MNSERRLAKLEASLPPRAAALRWLSEAHERGSLTAYLASLHDESGASPLVALAERVAAAARASHAREPRPMVREAERRAVMDTVFLVMLVLELEHATSEAIRVGSHRLEALRWERLARSAEGTADRRGWAAWRTAVLDLATDLTGAEAVRRTLAERYLDGREVLFLDTLAAWREFQNGVVALVEAITAVPGARRRRRAAGETIEAAAQRTVPEAASGLAELVRARTLDLLGVHAGALAIVEHALPRASDQAREAGS